MSLQRLYRVICFGQFFVGEDAMDFGVTKPMKINRRAFRSTLLPWDQMVPVGINLVHFP
jgi:hypothetical protein